VAKRTAYIWHLLRQMLEGIPWDRTGQKIETGRRTGKQFKNIVFLK
jgi:hypothetical protein